MSSSPVQPISIHMQQRVTDEVARYVMLAQTQYQQTFEPIRVIFDLKGRAAGMYRVKTTPSLPSVTSFTFKKTPPAKVDRVIRFNPWIFTKYPDDSWTNTIPHEVAHYIVDCLYGLARVRPHGNEWKQVMQNFGAQAIVRANYDLSDIPMRTVKRYQYACQCRQVPLTSYRHQKVQRGQQRYRCRDCSEELRYMA